jgi:transposase-like protein
MRLQLWVFGMRERGTNFGIFTIVENREATTLLPVIKKHVYPGSIIISDCWKAYSKISQQGYTHNQVNHSVNFVDPNSNTEYKVHTNGIESIWKVYTYLMTARGSFYPFILS